MFNKDDYGKILVPMVTPFKDDQSVDYNAAVNIAEKLIAEKKADTLILTGTTGEFFTMNYDERVKIFEIVKNAVGDKISLAAGTGAASTMEAIALSKKAEALGLKVRKMKKAEIIHAIQQAEGYTACFGESTGSCIYTDCYFMHDCFKNN